MGMHVGVIAVRASLSSLRAALTAEWPQLELSEESPPLRTWEEARSWAEARAKPLVAAEWSKENPGTVAVLLWQEGDWVVLFDDTYVMPGDEKRLVALSRRLGTAVGIVVESVTGVGRLMCTKDGAVRRHIEYLDGEVVHAEGERLAEEEGLSTDECFYMDEAEAISGAMGFSLYPDGPAVKELRALAFVDRMDYSALHPPAPKRPWWKFW